MPVVRTFIRPDRDQLTELVNVHIAAVVPGWALPVSALLAQFERAIEAAGFSDDEGRTEVLLAGRTTNADSSGAEVVHMEMPRVIAAGSLRGELAPWSAEAGPRSVSSPPSARGR